MKPAKIIIEVFENKTVVTFLDSNGRYEEEHLMVGESAFITINNLIYHEEKPNKTVN